MEQWIRELMTLLNATCHPPSENSNCGSSSKNTASNGQTALWAEEMDVRDPLLDNYVITNTMPPQSSPSHKPLQPVPL